MVRRVWLLVNIVVTLALVPALFTAGDDESPSSSTVLISESGGARASADALEAAAAAEVVTTTTTSTPPTTLPATTVAPPTTAAPKKQAVATSTPTTAAPKPKPKPTTTTTTAPPPPQPATAGKSESGRATWYELEGARAGICAHKTLPFGTIVTVTNDNTGKSIQCEVGDRGPFVDGYIIDLFRTDFEKLAPTSSGWFPATITW